MNMAKEDFMNADGKFNHGITPRRSRDRRGEGATRRKNLLLNKYSGFQFHTDLAIEMRKDNGTNGNHGTNGACEWMALFVP